MHALNNMVVSLILLSFLLGFCTFDDEDDDDVTCVCRDDGEMAKAIVTVRPIDRVVPDALLLMIRFFVRV